MARESIDLIIVATTTPDTDARHWAQAMADRVRELRETYGITYFIVQGAHTETFAKVIAELR